MDNYIRDHTQHRLTCPQISDMLRGAIFHHDRIWRAHGTRAARKYLTSLIIRLNLLLSKYVTAMAGLSNPQRCSHYQDGYQFQNEAELREVRWLIKEGDYKNPDDYGLRTKHVKDRARKAAPGCKAA